MTDATLDPVPGFDEIADELYGLPPEEFTAARTRYEKKARQGDDRELAARVHGLGKPSVTAWLANQLVRERRDELLALPELGARLREATERLAGDELRELSRKQHELVSALVRQARQLATATGHAVSEDTARGLEDTLHAALADEQATEQLLGGRLTQALQRTGFGDTPTPNVGATIGKPSGSGRRRLPRGDEHMRRVDHDLAQQDLAEQDLAEAERVLADARKARDDARGQAADADRVAAAAKGEVEKLRRQLDEAGTEASEASRRRRERSTALRGAERAVTDAERRRTAAQQRRDRAAESG